MLENDGAVVLTISATEWRRCTATKESEKVCHQAGGMAHVRMGRRLGDVLTGRGVSLPEHDGLKRRPAFAWGSTIRRSSADGI